MGKLRSRRSRHSRHYRKKHNTRHTKQRVGRKRHTRHSRHYRKKRHTKRRVGSRRKKGGQWEISDDTKDNPVSFPPEHLEQKGFWPTSKFARGVGPGAFKGNNAYWNSLFKMRSKKEKDAFNNLWEDAENISLEQKRKKWKK